FGGNNYSLAGQLELDLSEQLNSLDKKYQYQPQNQTCSGRFRELIQHLKETSGQPVVVLVDEYDKPILDALSYPEVARANRDFLRGFYGTIKDYDAHIRFSFLTGVSKFSKLFKRREFKSYWFETGTPTFLVNTLTKRHVVTPLLDQLSSDDELLSSFDVDEMAIEALMFQTGYLTIKEREHLSGNYFYTLGYPNREVYQSLNNSLLKHLVQDGGTQVRQRLQLRKLLLANDFEGLKTLFHSFFSSIPHHWYSNNDIQGYEGFYASVFYSYFAALGLDVTVEDCTNHGRLDMALKFNE
ncbi:unnamed protein product, partial [Cyprideis torosa]